MNLAITKAIEQATDSKVTYEINHKHGHTVYHIAKPIFGTVRGVDVTISNDFHANVQSDDVAKTIVKEAVEKFAKVRAYWAERQPVDQRKTVLR
jgi:hypothetical protein